MKSSSEDLRNAMRNWTTGVSIVCSLFENTKYGMTVNSFNSVSLEPPVISITLANKTRTLKLIHQSGKFSVSILRFDQKWISDRFGGKFPEILDRFKDLDTIFMPGGQIAISNSLVCIECEARKFFPMEKSTLILGDVENSMQFNADKPLIYHNRGYYSL